MGHPVAGGAEADTKAYTRIVTPIIKGFKRKDKAGKRRRIDYEIGGFTTDSASVMATAR